MSDVGSTTQLTKMIVLKLMTFSCLLISPLILTITQFYCEASSTSDLGRATQSDLNGCYYDFLSLLNMLIE
jgi:hypothetical protein